MNGCSCECNSGGFCGGCGHAGCGRRAPRVNSRDRYGYVEYPMNRVMADLAARLRGEEDAE